MQASGTQSRKETGFGGEWKVLEKEGSTSGVQSASKSRSQFGALTKSWYSHNIPRYSEKQAIINPVFSCIGPQWKLLPETTGKMRKIKKEVDALRNKIPSVTLGTWKLVQGRMVFSPPTPPHPLRELGAPPDLQNPGLGHWAKSQKRDVRTKYAPTLALTYWVSFPWESPLKEDRSTHTDTHTRRYLRGKMRQRENDYEWMRIVRSYTVTAAQYHTNKGLDMVLQVWGKEK